MSRTPEPARGGAGAVRVSLVVAVAENGVIGRGGGLPWHLPDDLRHFKAVTLGKAVLMGGRTFESIGRALPGRRNLVMSRAGGPTPGVEYVGSVEKACELIARGARDAAGAAGAEDPVELCVIGGAQVYALALPYATRIYLTCVQAVVEGDVYFPGASGAPFVPGVRAAPDACGVAGVRGVPGVGGARFAMPDGWREVERIEHMADARHAYAMSFVTLER